MIINNNNKHNNNNNNNKMPPSLWEAAEHCRARREGGIQAALDIDLVAIITIISPPLIMPPNKNTLRATKQILLSI